MNTTRYTQSLEGFGEASDSAEIEALDRNTKTKPVNLYEMRHALDNIFEYCETVNSRQRKICHEFDEADDEEICERFSFTKHYQSSSSRAKRRRAVREMIKETEKVKPQYYEPTEYMQLMSLVRKAKEHRANAKDYLFDRVKLDKYGDIKQTPQFVLSRLACL